MLLLSSDQQHEVFVEGRKESSGDHSGPSIPPGFNIVHIGKQLLGDMPLRVGVAVVWDKHKFSTGIAWVTNSVRDLHQTKYGGFCYASSQVAAEAMACLKAVTWARDRCRVQESTRHDEVESISSDSSFARLWGHNSQMEYRSHQEYCHASNNLSSRQSFELPDNRSATSSNLVSTTSNELWIMASFVCLFFLFSLLFILVFFTVIKKKKNEKRDLSINPI